MRPLELSLLPPACALVLWSASREPFLQASAMDALLSLGVGLPLLAIWLYAALRLARALRASPSNALAWVRLVILGVGAVYLAMVPFGFLSDLL